MAQQTLFLSSASVPPQPRSQKPKSREEKEMDQLGRGDLHAIGKTKKRRKRHSPRKLRGGREMESVHKVVCA